MKKQRYSIIMTKILGILTVFCTILSYLALTDIAHGIEPDLSMEWNTLRISALIIVFFVASVFYNLSIQSKKLSIE